MIEFIKAVNNLRTEIKKVFLPVIEFFDKHPLLFATVYISAFLIVAGISSFGIYDMTQMILNR